ncbi:MAG TPA: PilZ domain-containing protein [Anaeromyxobacteraceae bacterium]|nr:PilZ domain-containing protein [Anaeromyxobacteraceae bacterium]
MEYIQNPRRSARAPARCRAKLGFSDGARLEADTEDVSAHGCQVVTPRALPVDAAISVELSCPSLPEPLAVQGRVAWCTLSSPFRVGIAFEKGGQRSAGRWFEALLAADPSLAPRRGVPDRIRSDATLYLGPPPRHVIDFTAEEVEILRHVAAGATAGSLRTSFRDRWPSAQYALFSLLTRHAVTLDRGAAAHAEAWRPILQQAEASLALESLGSSPSPSPPPGRAAPAAPAAGRPPPRLAEPGRWRTPGAQALYEKALKDLEEGRFAPAQFALQQALALSPGDAEIARALASAMSRERPKGG